MCCWRWSHRDRQGQGKNCGCIVPSIIIQQSKVASEPRPPLCPPALDCQEWQQTLLVPPWAMSWNISFFVPFGFQIGRVCTPWALRGTLPALLGIEIRITKQDLCHAAPTFGNEDKNPLTYRNPNPIPGCLNKMVKFEFRQLFANGFAKKKTLPIVFCNVPSL